MEDGRREDMDVILLMPSKLGLCRTLVGPGSLSLVVNEMTDTPLGKSDEDME